MSRLALLAFLLGCGGAATPASAPAPARVMVAQPGVDPPPPPPPAAPVEPAPAPAPEPPADQVATDDADPCMGGEATGSMRGGGVTGVGAIGIGRIGTSGHGTGTGTGYGGLGRRKSTSPVIKVGTPAVSGQLDKDVIRRIVRRHIAQIRYCYEKQLTSTPKLEGKVTAKWTITAQGTVDTATAGGLHADVDACIANRIKTWQFPKPKGGVVTVSYPFVFKAAE